MDGTEPIKFWKVRVRAPDLTGNTIAKVCTLSSTFKLNSAFDGNGIYSPIDHDVDRHEKAKSPGNKLIGYI